MLPSRPSPIQTRPIFWLCLFFELGAGLSAKGVSDQLPASDPGSAPAAVRSVKGESDSNPWLVYPELVFTRYPDSVVEPGQAFHLALPLVNRTDRIQQAHITLQLLDFWETPVGSPVELDIELKAGGRQTIPASFPVSRLGSYKIQATIAAHGRQRSRDVVCFAVLPAGNPPDHPFFGAHINGSLNELGRRLGFSGNRVHNMTQFTWWVRMQPERDAWSPADESYQNLRALGYSNFGQWFGAPYWAVTGRDGRTPERPTERYPKGWVPTDRAAFKAYLLETLKRFPEITEWEVWNEPYVSMFWSGSPKEYAELCKFVYATVKSLRPDLLVYAQLPDQGPWLRTFAETGGLESCDGVSYHWYTDWSQHPQAGARTVQRVRENLRRYSKKYFPLVMSEGGVSGGTFLRGLDLPTLPAKEEPSTYRQAAERMVQSRITMLAAGVKANYYYFHQPVPVATMSSRGSYATMEVVNAPRPAAVAHAILTWQLAGGTFEREITTWGAGLRCYLFNRKDGQSVALAWAEDGARADLTVEAQAVDLMGNPLPVGSPVHLESTPVYLRSALAPDRFGKLLAGASVRPLQAPRASIADSEEPAQPVAMDAFPITAEMQTLQPISLAAAANMALADEAAGDGSGGWMDEGPFNDMRMLSPGPQTWLGAPFSIAGSTKADKAVVSLQGNTFPAGPTEATIITHLSGRQRGLLFAHSANWATQRGIRVAEYVIRYADGRELVLPVVTGENIGNGWSDHALGEESRTVGFRHPDPLDPRLPWRFIRLWYWENARADSTIEAVTIRKVAPASGVVLLGLTAVNW